MTDRQSNDAVRRPLLVNGEALKLDVQSPNSGGGEKHEPQTVEQAQALLAPQITAAVAAAEALPSKLRARDRIYVEAKLLPNYLAASYFPTELLAHVGAAPVGSRADIGQYVTKKKNEISQTRRLIFTVTDDGLRELQRLISAGGRTRTEEQAFTQIRELSEIALPRESDVLRAPENTAAVVASAPLSIWEAVLHPRGSRLGEAEPLDEETLEQWFALIQHEGGEVHRDYVRTVGGLTFTPVGLASDKAASLARFNPLRVLRPMPAIRPRPRFGTRSVQRLTAPATNQPALKTVSVAVFDGGVDTVHRTAPLFAIPTHDLTPEAPDQGELDHGTGVTGAVLYGLVKPGQQAPTPPLPVESYRVLPAPHIPGDLEGYWVLDQIKEAVETKGHRLVNLSLGPTLAVEDDMEPNRWTSELDQLAWDKDVLFVVAAGNDGEQDRAAGLHRVQVPADMANGLAVGACDAPAPETPWERVPYSSMGPGRHGARIQPLGVQFGGTANRMFNVVRADGSFLDAAGTSFAAPVTTHALADLVTRLPRVNSSVLRAFATHFAQRPRQHVKLRDEVGYGRQPLSFDDFLECAPNEAHVLYVDEIERGDLLGYQVPVADPGTTNLKLNITLAYASPVDPTQPTEYTSASLELVLRPHHRIYTAKPPKGSPGKSLPLDIGSPEAGTLLSQGWELSQEPVTKTLGAAKGGASEAQLRDSGKWETVRNYRVTLKPGEVELPRLELSYIARRSGALDNSPTKVPFALLISVVDDSGTTNVYDNIRTRFGALRPAQRARTRLQTRSSATPHWY
ncbi:S8 family peptidase [Arsenicicoccus bolidensis]|uniref:S8 family peptidase n=1 Tax=Arsenicicoccus bolidensis TaxID=229480 RepID=A0ABS9PZJ2_9MICO|nr:S8 family peptidase [Arsenicicoccus bolidensis]MCG7321056.1 S8 family peptidase [Arsenicicoccus bolidensis]